MGSMLEDVGGIKMSSSRCPFCGSQRLQPLTSKAHNYFICGSWEELPSHKYHDRCSLIGGSIMEHKEFCFARNELLDVLKRTKGIMDVDILDHILTHNDMSYDDALIILALEPEFDINDLMKGDV